jgi:hypothetical protein
VTAEQLQALSPEALSAYLKSAYGLTPEQVVDACNLPTPEARRVWLDGMSGLDWTKPGTPAWQVLLDELPVIGTILGVATGAAQLGAAVKAL